MRRLKTVPPLAAGQSFLIPGHKAFSLAYFRPVSRTEGFGGFSRGVGFAFLSLMSFVCEKSVGCFGVF